LTDEQVLEMAFNAKNGDKFRALWEDKNWEPFLTGKRDDKTHSAADIALIDILAFYSDNHSQIERLWKASPLSHTQPKRNTRPSWIRNIIRKALREKIQPINQETQIALTNQVRQDVIHKQGQILAPDENWTVPPGIVGDIAQFIFSDAYSPLKEVALAGAIAYFAGLVGRAYDIGGLSLNQYICVLAPTGSGKEGAKTAITKLNRHVQATLPQAYNIYERLGPEAINSAQGLYKKIAKNPCCVSLLSEFGLLLQDICDNKANETKRNIRSALLKLYSSKHVGTNAYADDAKNGTVIDNPAYTIFGESTQLNFYKAITEQTISEGFLPRLTIVEYQGPVPVPNEAEKAPPNPFLILKLAEIFQLARMNEIKQDTTMVAYTFEAEEYRRQLATKWRLQTDTHNINKEDHLAELCTRMMQKIIRLAALISVGINWREPTIDFNVLKWSEKLVMHGFKMIHKRFESGEVGESSDESKQYQIIERELDMYIKYDWEQKLFDAYRVTELMKKNGIVTYHYLDCKTKGKAAFKNSHNPKMALDNTVARLVDNGILDKVLENDAVRATPRGGIYSGRMWRVC
jgi:hypothetical protein